METGKAEEMEPSSGEGQPWWKVEEIDRRNEKVSKTEFPLLPEILMK